MPAILNIAVNLALGATLVLAVRRSPALHEGMLSWSLFALLAFEAAVFTPVATYLFRFHPQWSMLYWFDPQIFPELDRWTGSLSLLAVVLNFTAALGGYAVARLGVLTSRRWIWAAPLLAAVAVSAYVGVFFWRRIAFIGDYDEFWQGNAVPLFRCTPGWVGVVLYAATAAFVLWVARRFGDHDPSLV